MTARLGRQLAIALAVLMACLLPSLAWAQVAGLELRAQASASEVEVGQVFTIELRAMGDGTATPTAPDLRVPGSFDAQGPSVGTQTTMQFGGGQSITRSGITATWRVVAKRLGHYTIAGPTVTVGGRRVQANAITVDVVRNARQAPPQPSPFLMPGGPGGFSWPGQGFPGFDDRGDDRADDGAETSELDIPNKAPDPKIFLRAVADKTSAVVGEQVTLSFYIYYRVDFEMTERHEATMADFVRVAMMKSPDTTTRYATAGGVRYAVRLLDKLALFPVRTGRLHTGEMAGRFTGRRIGARIEKRSNDIVVEVSDPPAAGRPAGFTSGDVGKFKLSAIVQPRKIEQGGSVSVTLKVTGTGNFPTSLKVPARTGIEWLEPVKRESIEPTGDVIGGYRSFAYMTRVNESGAVDLGEVELPYWDPAAKRYDVARVKLGTVQATPSQTPVAAASPTSADDEPLAAMPRARDRLGAFEARRRSPLGGPAFWWLVGSPPVLALAGLFSAQALRAARERREASLGSASTLAAEALRALDVAKDGRSIAAAAERALHHVIEDKTGLKSRGVLLADLPRELMARGVTPELAARIERALSACESVRYDPTADEGAREDLAAETRAIAKDMARSTRK